MDAIEILMNEHRLILRSIDALLEFTERMQQTAGDDRPGLARFVDFIATYADDAHHGKEEGVLFPAMVAAGFPARAGPVGMMLHEHDIGRAFTRVLRDLSRQAQPWTDSDRGRLAEAAHGYGGLLQSHIHKEDQILYPMAQARLPEAAMQAVDAGCAAVDRKWAENGERARLEALAAELAGGKRAASGGGVGRHCAVERV